MAATNMQNLSVDSLFEQHSVPEIDIIQKKIQGVVEQKREELRTMVGERYRDLLQAADTIASMQMSAGTLIEQIENISTNCRSLNEKQLKGFEDTSPTEQFRQRNSNKELNNYFSTMVQIKLLTSLPEMIWSRIDHERFYAATELFTFSRHISTGLQLNSQNELMQHLPLAKKQWETLKPFHLTIKQCVIQVLESEDLNAETAADCLLSLLLLEKSNFNAIVKTFLQLRCAAFLACFRDSAAGDENAVAMRRIKERILASLKVLNGTMKLLGECLLENGLVLRKLEDLKDAQNPPTIALMDESKYSHLLPEIIANFRPKIELQSLDKDEVTKAIEQWLVDTKHIGEVHLKNLFDLVPNMSTIQEIKHKAKEFKKELDLTNVISNFNLKQSLDFYDSEYVPLINQRIRDIIENSWKQAIQTMIDSIEKVINDGDYLMDINIWQENPTDLPESLHIALSDERKSNKLLMKIRGYDSKIIQNSTLFDEQLAAIITEMNVLIEEPMARADDKLALVEFLRETSQNQLNEFLTKLKAHNLPQSKRKELLFVARSCAAIVELCPNLKICFCQQANWRQWMGTSAQLASTSFDHWQRICLLIEDETQRFWAQIVDGVLQEQNSIAQLPAKLTHEVLLEDFVHWESLSLNQKDEHDNLVISTLRIPSQPRISLQTYLFSIVSLLNASIPQTLPLKVLNTFNRKLLAQLLTHYKTHSSDESLSNNQYIALQLYFDLKFLQSIFRISREDRLLNEQFQTLQSTFKNFVDPFDFELFAEHISANVKRTVSRLSCQLGVLVRSGPATGGQSTAPLSQERDPNVLSLSTNSPTSVWFPLLPIVTKSSESKAVPAIEEQQPATSAAEKTTPRKTSRKSNDSNQKAKSTGATSFFGSMWSGSGS